MEQPAESRPSTFAAVAWRLRVLTGRASRRLGVGDDGLLVPLAAVVGVVTAAAAVGFHELILLVRDLIYGHDFPTGPRLLVVLLAPAAGGLIVGVVARLLSDGREGHGVVDVMESVARTRGFVRFRSVLEKIFTSAVTIGTGGSAGAEGPIVQIGAAVSSGVAGLFGVARHQMPVLVGCGTAAGISAIFNAPIGGLLFTLEVILLDFSARAITPIVVAAVVANVTMRALIGYLHAAGLAEGAYITVFADPSTDLLPGPALLNWPQVPAYVGLGLLCGAAGAIFIRSMHAGEGVFRRLIGGPPWVKALRPAVGGLMLGALGLAVVLLTGGGPPARFEGYPMPAFFGDGYRVIEGLLRPDFDAAAAPATAVAVLIALVLFKLLATILTLASGGSGGVIAPALFIGAGVGGAWGTLLRGSGLFDQLRPAAVTLVGMAAVLAAVVHAPLASILILLELTNDSRVLLPALLGVVVALGTAKVLAGDSIYTGDLRRRGVRRAGADPAVLGRLTVEQVSLDPAAVVRADDPFERVIELADRWRSRDFVVVDAAGRYAGFLPAEAVDAALIDREATPLMVVGELMRADVPLVSHADELGRAFDLFARLDVSSLAVGLGDGQVLGTISRAALMRRYQRELGR